MSEVDIKVEEFQLTQKQFMIIATQSKTTVEAVMMAQNFVIENVTTFLSQGCLPEGSHTAAASADSCDR